MYTWIWRHLPGSLGWKLAQTLLLIALACALLLFVAFPWIEPKLPIGHATVGQ